MEKELKHECRVADTENAILTQFSSNVRPLAKSVIPAEGLATLTPEKKMDAEPVYAHRETARPM